MADNKATTLHPPQPITGTLPVKAYVYRAIAEMNAGFEKVIQDLNNLKQINYLHSDPFTAMHDTICAIRARANRELMAALSRREQANAAHFERLCAEHEELPFASPSASSQEPPPAQ